MGRYRPPAEKKSPYITAAGHARLEVELAGLWVTRREVTVALSAAAAEGDRSENAEYIYRKKQLREIDRRIRYLQKRLDELKVVDTLPTDRERVFFGAWIELEDVQGELSRHRIVGPDEFDEDPAYISVDAPLAKAVLGKRLDDEIRFETPSGVRELVIVSVQYES